MAMITQGQLPCMGWANQRCRDHLERVAARLLMSGLDPYQTYDKLADSYDGCGTAEDPYLEGFEEEVADLISEIIEFSDGKLSYFK